MSHIRFMSKAKKFKLKRNTKQDKHQPLRREINK